MGATELIERVAAGASPASVVMEAVEPEFNYDKDEFSKLKKEYRDGLEALGMEWSPKFTTFLLNMGSGDKAFNMTGGDLKPPVRGAPTSIDRPYFQIGLGVQKGSGRGGVAVEKFEQTAKTLDKVPGMVKAALDWAKKTKAKYGG